MDPQKIKNIEIRYAVDLLVRFAVIAGIFIWCFTILSPFLIILLWGAIIAIAFHPLFVKLVKLSRGKKTPAAVVITLVLLAVMVVPSFYVVESVFSGLQQFKDLYAGGKLQIPPPEQVIQNWPNYTQPIKDAWLLASEHLEEALSKFSEPLKGSLSFILGLLAGTGKGLLEFMVSIIAAGVLLRFDEGFAGSATKIFKKVGGSQGEEFLHITVITIRNVVRGILGIAFLQTLMAGLGFFIAGVPYSGLLTLICLVLAIVQAGISFVAVPVMIYMFTLPDKFTAIVLTIWLIFTIFSENILKPILLGRNAPVPMLVVFFGAIGGFFTIGFLGLFVGAVILSIGYKLFQLWIAEPIEG